MPKYKDSPEERAANELMKKQIQEVYTRVEKVSNKYIDTFDKFPNGASYFSNIRFV